MENNRQLTVNALRVLSAEAIQKANSGHPGMALGAAPIAYALFQQHLNFNSKNLKWDNRDRFVLSAGHGSSLLYSLFHLYGMGITKQDLMNFRQLGSLTPGHPEYGSTAGVETTTGPLGQGIANAVGMAMAEAHLAATYNQPDFPVVDHYTYALCGDGCLEEGISYEACSFAGVNKLGKLIVLYDNNDITIEGALGCTFKEDVAKRFEAQNWEVLHVDLVNNPDDIDLLSAAIEQAKANKEQPSIIICKTHIGYGSPLENSEKCHGAALGVENLEKTKVNLGWECEPFEAPQEVFDHCNEACERGENAAQAWQEMFEQYEAAYPELAAQYKKVMSGERPDFSQREDFFNFDKPMATRQTSSAILNKIAAELPSLMGGSADLGPSNLSIMKNTDENTYGEFSADNYAGRNVHFGIREHAMVAICNGMQLHGGVDAYCATFFIFTDYCKNAIRLSALMKLPVFYIFTHDSIGVGEDGPTHEPIEQLIGLRSIPGLKVFRPADGKETAAAYVSAMNGNQPTALVLSRQNLPQYENSGLNALKGGYILDDCEGTPQVILMGTGSEIELCMNAKAKLAEMGVKARVVSMPCLEEFEKQTEEYKNSVLPRAVKARVCVEAATPHSWYRYAGDYGEIIAMESFGASAPAGVLFKHFGFTVENVVEKALRSMQRSPIKIKLVGNNDAE
ncbi:MAG: transketolase [Clostridia bacterium]|nr:transketolase [Clostridia bacterium]